LIKLCFRGSLIECPHSFPSREIRHAKIDFCACQFYVLHDDFLRLVSRVDGFSYDGWILDHCAIKGNECCYPVSMISWIRVRVISFMDFIMYDLGWNRFLYTTINYCHLPCTSRFYLIIILRLG
jgi:hypothetical protein